MSKNAGFGSCSVCRFNPAELNWTRGQAYCNECYPEGGDEL